MHSIAQQEKELDNFKSVAQSLQKQIVEVCCKTVVDSDTLRTLRAQKMAVQKNITALSNRLLSDIIA